MTKSEKVSSYHIGNYVKCVWLHKQAVILKPLQEKSCGIIKIETTVQLITETSIMLSTYQCMHALCMCVHGFMSLILNHQEPIKHSAHTECSLALMVPPRVEVCESFSGAWLRSNSYHITRTQVILYKKQSFVLQSPLKVIRCFGIIIPNN